MQAALVQSLGRKLRSHMLHCNAKKKKKKKTNCNEARKDVP